MNTVLLGFILSFASGILVEFFKPEVVGLRGIIKKDPFKITMCLFLIIITILLTMLVIKI